MNNRFDNTPAILPMSPMRKVIAARMVEAKQTIPHFRVTAEICLDSLMMFRNQYNADKPDDKLSINDFFIKACALALVECPALNCQLVDEQIYQFPQADISVIMAVDGGLTTPIIRSANAKTVKEISIEVKNLATRAIEGQLKMKEIQGGSFSLSNLGMYSVDGFDAIINPPQCAILSVAAAKQKPVVDNHAISIATQIHVELSMDHRVLDGAAGANFLSCLHETLQKPDQLIVGL